jgi:hypothetical protein
MSSAKKGGALGTGPRLGTTDLKNGDSTAGGTPNRGDTESNITNPSSFLTNTGAGESAVAQNAEFSSG